MENGSTGEKGNILLTWFKQVHAMNVVLYAGVHGVQWSMVAPGQARGNLNDSIQFRFTCLSVHGTGSLGLGVSAGA
jgi:hypothetical protein